MENQWFYEPLPGSPDEKIWSSPKTSRKNWTPVPITKSPKPKNIPKVDIPSKVYTEFEKKVAIDNVNFYRKQSDSILIQKTNFLNYYGLNTEDCIAAYKQIEDMHLKSEKRRQDAEFYYYKTVGVVHSDAKDWSEHWRFSMRIR
jgi:hypothetical protein